MIAESEVFDYLDAPIVRLGGADVADSLQPGAREGRGAAGGRHRRGGAEARAARGRA